MDYGWRWGWLGVLHGAFGELLFRWRWFADTMLQVVVVLGEVVWEK